MWEGILKICESYFKSPLACAVGVIGVDMKKRIQTIMKHSIGSKLSFVKKLMSAVAGVAALTFPIYIVLLNTPSSLAQLQTGSKPSFEVASVKTVTDCGNVAPVVQSKIPSGPSYQPGGRYTTCSQLEFVIMDAYNIEIISRVIGVPDWSDNTLYKIEAKAEGNPDKERMRLMVQSLLEERFKLEMHREMQETPIYMLVVAKGGHKLQQAKDEKGKPILSLPDPELYRKKERERRERMADGFSPSDIISMLLPGSHAVITRPSGSIFNGKAMSMERFATFLIGITYPTTGRKVIDKTGLTGFYDVQLTYANPFNQQASAGTTGPASTKEPSTPTIFEALQQQLGLKLEEDKITLDHFIIDRVERPSEN